ncbi:hypothetical protein [Roseicella aerolata]|uniref:Uncharacterized protein n=1 Tax=Roseicella aerolata TaxID=2883479 RepID=A0A9X1ICP0_9PROT|nr:hypothetical protein [Roseicella aerolata]MCB4821776.1 hypothetical protein [Roseicella aerolata]
MPLRSDEMERSETRQGQGRLRPRDEAPDRGARMRERGARRPAAEREAVFDIADFAAIAQFAGIVAGRRAG